MLTRLFVVIALLACNSNAASLQSSATRQKWEDLEVMTLDSQGDPAKSVYYSYDQLLTLPTVTVETERDPNTNTPATYTGIYISDLFEAFGADISFDVIGANCLDKYKPYRVVSLELDPFQRITGAFHAKGEWERSRSRERSEDRDRQLYFLPQCRGRWRACGWCLFGGACREGCDLQG